MNVNEEVNKPLASCFEIFCSRKRSDCVTCGFDFGQYFKLVDPLSVNLRKSPQVPKTEK